MEAISVPFKKTMINPWAHQTEKPNMEKIPGVCTILSSAGTMRIDDAGNPVFGTLSQQLMQSFENMKLQLEHNGYALSDVTTLNFYTTSLEDFFTIYDVVAEKLKAFKLVPSCMLKEVKVLAFPGMQIELEAVAAK